MYGRTVLGGDLFEHNRGKAMRFASLANRNFKEIYRDWISLTLGIGLPALLLIVFMLIQKRLPVDIYAAKSLTPAVIVFSFAFLNIFSAIVLAKDRDTAFLTRLLVSPLKSRDYILAYSLPFFPVALLQIIVGYIIGIIFGLDPTVSMITSLVVLIPTAIIFIGLGLMIGSLFSVKQAPGIGTLVIITSSFLGGAWMDLKLIGGAFEKIGYALPFAHAIDATREIIAGADFSSILPNLIWVVGYAVLFYLLGVIAFWWKTRP